MSFTLSKILGFLLQPSTLATSVILLGLVLMSRERGGRWGKRLAWGGVLFLLVAGLLPVGNVLIFPLEERFARVPAPAADAKIAGIIILGGFEDGPVSASRGGLAVNESAERLTEGVRFALRHPEAKVVFTGGVGSLWPGGRDAVDAIAAYMREMGIAESRLVLEGRSRNTEENALFTAELVKSQAGETWVLVTSAYHMPRAVGLYRKAGFDVTPYPVDYRTRGVVDLLRPFERISAGLMRTDTAATEWLGLFAYWASGKIDDVFPAP